MTKIRYSKELIENACKDSKSIAQVCEKIGLKPVGSNYKTVKKKIELYNVDISHFTGKLWNKGLKNTEKTSRLSLNEILNKNVNYKPYRLRLRLIEAGIKEEKCEICGYTENLELHHINGDHYDNRLENLQILCPNCHAKTDNFRNRNGKNTNEGVKLSDEYKKLHYRICQNCNKEFYSDRISTTRKFCSRLCYMEYLQKIKNGSVKPLQTHESGIGTVSSNLISKEDLIKATETYNTITAIAEHFDVHRQTARTYLKKYDLYEQFKTKPK